MATERIAYCIGYIGMTLHYHYINLVVPSEGKISNSSVVKEKFKSIPPKVIMLSPRRKFFKIHKTKKESKNYEGQGRNKK